MPCVRLGWEVKHQMEPLTAETWQWLWNKKGKDMVEVHDWLLGLITEAGFDVRDDVVVRP